MTNQQFDKEEYDAIIDSLDFHREDLNERLKEANDEDTADIEEDIKRLERGEQKVKTIGHYP